MRTILNNLLFQMVNITLKINTFLNFFFKANMIRFYENSTHNFVLYAIGHFDAKLVIWETGLSNN